MRTSPPSPGGMDLSMLLLHTTVMFGRGHLFQTLVHHLSAFHHQLVSGSIFGNRISGAEPVILIVVHISEIPIQSEAMCIFKRSYLDLGFTNSTYFQRAWRETAGWPALGLRMEKFLDDRTKYWLANSYVVLVHRKGSETATSALGAILATLCI